MLWDKECILNTEFLIRQVKTVAQEFNLASSSFVNKWCCFGQVIDRDILTQSSAHSVTMVI